MGLRGWFEEVSETAKDVWFVIVTPEEWAEEGKRILQIGMLVIALLAAAILTGTYAYSIMSLSADTTLEQADPTPQEPRELPPEPESYMVMLVENPRICEGHPCARVESPDHDPFLLIARVEGFSFDTDTYDVSCVIEDDICTVTEWTSITELREFEDGI